MEEKDIIATNITYYRKKLGLSQLELSEKLRYSNKNISKWEKGETTPSIFTLKRLAEIFEISLDELMLPVDKNIENNDLQQPLNVENQNQSTKKKKDKEPKPPMPFKAKLVYLLMANAILLIVAFIAIYVLEVIKFTTFNKWLILLYILPLSAISVTIFVRCIFKYVDLISLSIAIWLTALSFYLSAPSAPAIGYVFLITFAVELIIICMALLINFHLVAKFKKHLWKRKNKNAEAITEDKSQQNDKNVQ